MPEIIFSSEISSNPPSPANGGIRRGLRNSNAHEIRKEFLKGGEKIK